MQLLATLESDEWDRVRLVLLYARVLTAAAAEGALKGAVNTDSDSGKALLPMLKDLANATRELPESIVHELPE